MGKPVKGDVVVIPFPFSDLSGSKRRPAFVVKDLTGDDIILCQITSVARTDKFAVSLKTADFIQGALPVDSFIRPNKIFTADKSLIQYSAGHVSDLKIAEVIQAICSLIQN